MNSTSIVNLPVIFCISFMLTHLVMAYFFALLQFSKPNPELATKETRQIKMLFPVKKMRIILCCNVGFGFLSSTASSAQLYWQLLTVRLWATRSVPGIGSTDVQTTQYLAPQVQTSGYKLWSVTHTKGTDMTIQTIYYLIQQIWTKRTYFLSVHGTAGADVQPTAMEYLDQLVQMCIV